MEMRFPTHRAPLRPLVRRFVTVVLQGKEQEAIALGLLLLVLWCALLPLTAHRAVNAPGSAALS
jgi:hypothetical protein